MRPRRPLPPALIVGLLAALTVGPWSPALQVGGAAGPARATAQPAVLPWIADDYGRAAAEGRERSLPIFVESWAPW